VQESALVSVDSLWTGYTTHVFGLGYSYDLNGRRVGLRHPATVAPQGAGVRDSVRYGYDPDHGGLAWIEGLGTGSRYDFGYNNARQLTGVWYPAGMTETRDYDADGRLRTRQTTAPAGGWWSGGVIGSDSLVHDARGKITYGGGLQGININVYNGHGHLIGASHARSPYSYEVMQTDALGNRHSRAHSGDSGEITGISTYEAGTGRLRWVHPTDTIISADSATYYHDFGGRQTGTRSAAKPVANPNFPHVGPQYLQNIVETISTFDDDQRMIEFRQLSTQQAGAGLNKQEYYRYDALGRRIWRHAVNGWLAGGMVRDSLCTRSIPSSECKSFVERTVWDGDQVLYEIRARAEPEDGVSTLENNATSFDPHFGRVVYTHGGGIDQPLEIVRLDHTSPVIAVPHADWRGSFFMVTFDSASHAICGPVIEYASSDGGCAQIDLLYKATAFLDASCPACADAGPRSWWGNQLTGQQDASGLLYRRNRYYDPKQGRFTQEDPIGLAGGLNLYGYANGDPVNFSDPFGLCPLCITAGAGGAAFGVIRVASNYLNDRPLTEGVAEDIVKGIAIGGTLGAAAPLLIGRGAGAAVTEGTLFMGSREGRREALGRGMAGVTGAQAATLRDALGRGRVDDISITRAADGSLTTAFSRAGRDGHQVLTRVIDSAGRTSSMVQRAWNSAGEQVHEHVWK
jgi:RHS repeat-associated protein